jgi:hypothetical protein
MLDTVACHYFAVCKQLCIRLNIPQFVTDRRGVTFLSMKTTFMQHQYVVLCVVYFHYCLQCSLMV